MKKFYRSGVASHPDIKNQQLLMHLVDFILTWRKGKQVRWHTVTKLANFFEKQEWVTEPSDRIKEHRVETRREYYNLKKSTGKSYST